MQSAVTARGRLGLCGVFERPFYVPPVGRSSVAWPQLRDEAYFVQTLFCSFTTESKNITKLVRRHRSQRSLENVFAAVGLRHYIPPRRKAASAARRLGRRGRERGRQGDDRGEPSISSALLQIYQRSSSVSRWKARSPASHRRTRHLLAAFFLLSSPSSVPSREKLPPETRSDWPASRHVVRRFRGRGICTLQAALPAAQTLLPRWWSSGGGAGVEERSANAGRAAPAPPNSIIRAPPLPPRHGSLPGDDGAR
ncbi:hypothetical protein MRX96_043252 [Rhipicephalus microplus]